MIQTSGQRAADAREEIRGLMATLAESQLRIRLADGLGGQHLEISDESELNVWEGRDFTWLFHAKGLMPALCRLKELEEQTLSMLREENADDGGFVMEI